MARISSIFIFLFTVLFSTAIAQEKSLSLSIQFLSNEQIADVNFKEAPLLENVKKTTAFLEGFFADYKKDQDIVIIQSFYTDRSPEYTIHARPAMLITEMETVLKKLNKIKKLESLLVTYHFGYILQIQAGYVDKEAPYVPGLIVPVQREFNTLKDAGLGEVRNQIQSWAQNDVLPVLAAFENKVDPKFAGVKAVGKILTDLDVKGEPDIVALTEGSTNYWRAIMEMTAGNQLISTSKIFMHVAVGEFDYANKYLEILTYFADPKTVAGHFLKELKWRMDIFQEELTAQINGGIMMHDANKYQPAIKTYERILMEYPNSAWALYELYFARNSWKLYLDPNEVDDRSDWDAAKKEIFKANPLYSLDVRASTGREGYLMMRRASISTLFQKEEEFDRDFVKYADIALDLEVYGFAAHLYWLTMLSIPKEEYEGRDLLSYFLYCLDKIGDKDIKKNFKGDFDKSFAEITGERRKLMEESPTYKAFEKQE